MAPPTLILAIIFSLVGLLFIGLGLPLARRRVPPNHLYGVRLPATLRNPDIWYEVNAESGKDLIRVGATILVCAIVLPVVPFLPPGAYGIILVVVTLAAALTMCARAFWLTGRAKRRRNT